MKREQFILGKKNGQIERQPGKNVASNKESTQSTQQKQNTHLIAQSRGGGEQNRPIAGQTQQTA